MTTVLYILLGVLVIGVVGLQTWIARSSSGLAGTRSGLVMSLRVFNIVLLVGAIALVVYALLGQG